MARFMRARGRRAWCWVFSVRIAGPAVVLALLGLRAARADRVEREQQVREQQTQTARLADAAIANAIERTSARLDRINSETWANPAQGSSEEFDPSVFLLDRRGVLLFPSRRIYFGPIGLKSALLKTPGTLSSTASQGIWDA